MNSFNFAWIAKVEYYRLVGGTRKQYGNMVVVISRNNFLKLITITYTRLLRQTHAAIGIKRETWRVIILTGYFHVHNKKIIIGRKTERRRLNVRVITTEQLKWATFYTPKDTYMFVVVV